VGGEELDPALQQALEMMNAYLDAAGSAAADVSAEEAAERDRWVAATVDISCGTTFMAEKLFAAEDSTADPMALAALMTRFQEETVKKHGFTLLQYGEASARWATTRPRCPR